VSARSRNDSWIVKPSALAVLRFDDEPERRRLLDRDIGGFGSAQDLVEQLGAARMRAPAWTKSRKLKIVGSRAHGVFRGRRLDDLIA